MNKIHYVIGALTVLLASMGSAVAAQVAPLPVEDGGLLFVAAAGLAIAIKIARFKNKR